MVVIDEEEYIDLDAQVENKIDPFTGQPAKFKMDKFYGKDMHLPNLTEKEAKDWFDWWQKSKIINFKYNLIDKNIESIPLVQQRPEFYSDQEAIDRNLRAAEVAEAKMKDAEHFAKQKRKDRLKLFDACLRQYLNTECNANHKIKYDV